MERSRSILRGTWLCVVAGALFVHPATSARADVFHVKADAAGAGDGSSWADAFADLQFALDAAVVGDEVRVATGTYRPSERTDPTDPRSVTFQLRSGVALHGGFAGTETSLAERTGLFEATILTGDLNADDAPITNPPNPADLPDEPTRAENAYHVVTGSGTDETAVLDGFTVTAGQADGEFPNDGGGGMLNDFGGPSVRNCIFRANTAFFGGGMLTNQGDPLIKRCRFDANYAENAGGGMHNQSSNPLLDECAFTKNVAQQGGAMANAGGSAPTLTHSSFRENTAALGGGMFNGNSSQPVLSRCHFEGNSAGREGGAIWIERGAITLTESVLEGNSSEFGGAIYAGGSDFTLNDCTMRHNTAERDGGVILQVSGTLTLNDCTIERNSARRGAGVAACNGEFLLNACRLAENSALDGSGVFSDGAKSTIVACRFEANGGAALKHAHVDCGSDVTNSVFVGNGAGIRCSNNSTATITNCTFTRNGTAVSVTQSSMMALANCIVWNDRMPDELRNQVNVTYSTIEGGWAFPGTGNIDADPLFVRPPDDGGDGWGDDARTPDIDEGANDDFGDLRLRAGSPGIDAGNNDVYTAALCRPGAHPLPITDMDDNPRFLDDPQSADTGHGGPPIVDMGAFEFILPGDFDFDYDVDLADYLTLLRCMNGPGAPFEKGCHPADLDLDGDVDLADLVRLQAVFTGS